MSTPILPNSQKIQKTVVKLQEVCQQFDTLNGTLDGLITQIDAEIQNSPLTVYYLKKSREAQNA
jgi:flagellar hook-associated protein FlgK